jgi:hypothetical protein
LEKELQNNPLLPVLRDCTSGVASTFKGVTDNRSANQNPQKLQRPPPAIGFIIGERRIFYCAPERAANHHAPARLIKKL